MEDESTYKVLRRDPTSGLLTKTRQLVTNLYEAGKIGLIQKKQLINSASLPPKVYGLPKIHKEGVPLRPVVSYINSPTCELARAMAKVLSPLGESVYNVKNSSEVVELVSRMQLPPGFILVSLDVVSLFTNVPVDLVREEVNDRFGEIRDHTPLEKEDVLKLLDFCLSAGYFVYEGNFYQQIDGVPMGSPLGSISADVVMQKCLNTVLENCPLRIGLVRKYVDDLLLTVHEEDVENLTQYFNGFHPKIKFTMEREVNGCLPYLDVLIQRDAGNFLSTTWYSKPCSSQRILNYNSLHPKNMVLNVGRNLVKRVKSLTTRQDVNLDATITSILKKNDFPSRVICRLLREDPSTRSRPVPRVDGEYERFHSLTYVRGVSEKLRRKIANATNARVAFKPARKVMELFSKVKDVVPKEQRSDVVYRIPCKDCNLSYIGTTGQLLRSRIQKHMSTIRLKSKTTALSSHAIEEDHSFDFPNTEILDFHHTYKKRMMLEALHIKANSRMVVNHRGDTAGIHNCYAGLLRREM